jgi:hypothetical protein
MSQERLSYDKTKEYTALSDLNLLGFLCATGSEWTSTISKESLAFTTQSLEEGKSGATRGIVLLTALAALLLLSAATLTQARVGFQIPQEIVKTTEVKSKTSQLKLGD